jgi:hypothetical protein
MVSELERYGTGSGIPLGLGVGATAALVANIQVEFAVVAAFGAMGGLVVGGFAGRFAEADGSGGDWAYRLLGFTLFVSLLVGGSLGALTAWMVDGSVASGALGGSAAGGAFCILMWATLVATVRRGRTAETPLSSD